MRRSPGGLLLLVAGVFAALSIGTLWLQRVAFTPSSDSSITHSILGSEEIRTQIATIVASADAPILSQSALQLREFIADDIARIPAGAALMSRFVADGHARVIGEHDDAVRITAEEQVTIVRDERVGGESPLTLPIREVGSVAFVNRWLGWIALVCFGLALVTLIAGVILRPERGEGTFALGVAFASTSAALVVFGFLIPLALPALSDDPWMGLFAQLAQHHRNVTLLLAVIALAIGGLVVYGTSSRRQRRQHSTPLNVGRYRDDRSWSR